jgi:cell division protein ZapA (FtsZ GTPase activity inhibitor)
MSSSKTQAPHSAPTKRRLVNINGTPLYINSSQSSDEIDLIVETANARIRELKSVIPDSHECLLFVILSLTSDLLSAEGRLEEIKGGTQEKVAKILEAMESFERRHLH